MDIKAVAFCPNCCNVAPQTLLYSYYYSGKGFSYTDEEPTPLPSACFLAKCDTCQEVLVYADDIFQLEDKDFIEAGLVYPGRNKLHPSIPKHITKIHEAATRIQYLNANAFAGQIRRCLEAVCIDRGAKKDTLHKMLKELAAKGEIPSTLSKMTDVLRVLGNTGAHFSETTILPVHVFSINEFFNAVVEYIYVAPAKLKRFQETLAALKKEEAVDMD